MTCFTVSLGDVLNVSVSGGVSATGVYKTGTSPLTVTCTANLEEA